LIPAVDPAIPKMTTLKPPILLLTALCLFGAALAPDRAPAQTDPRPPTATARWMPLAEAQRTVPALGRRISLELRGATVEQALRAIAERAELSLAFSQALPDLRSAVSLAAHDEPAAELLARVLRGTRLEAVVSAGGQVVVREVGTTTARNGSVYGRVVDEAGAPVGSALLSLYGDAATGARRSVLSDAQGMYRLLGVPPGAYRLQVSRLGYQPDTLGVTIRGGEALRRDIVLRTGAVAIQGLQVRAHRDENRERARFESEAGITARVIAGEQVKLLPGFAEADVVRAIEVLPGVISTSDFSGSFNVRGGSADQNLILLDGFPIYNPFHFGGLFSVFNSDAVALAELQAGGFGAEYGGRVSSVLNVESRLEPDDRLRVDAGVSILATRMLARSALPGDVGSWFFSARRSYFDQLFPASAEIPHYHLTDFQGGLRLRTARGGRVTLLGYTGRDVLREAPVSESDTAALVEFLNFSWRWGNDVAGLHWQQPLGAGWILDTRVGESRFTDHLRIPEVLDIHLGSDVRHRMLRADVRRELSVRSTLRVGSELARIRADNVERVGGTTTWSREAEGTQSSSWTSVQWRPTDRWILDTGLRLDGWTAGDTTRLSLAPRFAAKRFLGADHEAAVKLALGRYTQFVHSLRVEDIPIGNDRWIVADRQVPHVVSDHVQLGYERFWGETWYLSLEGYHRTFRGVVAWNPVEDPRDPADDVLEGTGRAYGADLLLRRSAGRMRGWTSFSLLRATRTFDDPLALGWQEQPRRVTYAPIFDRRVDADFVLEYDLPRGFEAGLRWNYGSGLPYTRPAAQYAEWEYDLGTGRYGSGSDGGFYALPGERNAERYPAYHRLDFTLRRPYTRRWGTATPYLQVLNAYDRRNVMLYEYDFDSAPPARTGLSQFPILPALGVEVSF
jgi:hypothetical protein